MTKTIRGRTRITIKSVGGQTIMTKLSLKTEIIKIPEKSSVNELCNCG